MGTRNETSLPKHPLGSNDNDDRRQREGHKTVGLMSENNVCACAFYLLFYPSKTTLSNAQIMVFMENMNTLNFSFSIQQFAYTREPKIHCVKWR